MQRGIWGRQLKISSRTENISDRNLNEVFVFRCLKKKQNENEVNEENNNNRKKH